MNKPLLALLCMAVGALVTGVSAVALKKWRLGRSQAVAELA
jgi:PTS system fructose-specific IIC component